MIRHRQARTGRARLWAASIALCLLAFGLTLHAQSSAPVAQQPVAQPEKAAEARGRLLAEHVSQRARLATPLQLDARLDRLRAGAVDAETAALLGVSLVELSDASSLRALAAVAAEELTAAEAEARAAAAALGGAFAVAGERAAASGRAADASWAERAGLRLRWLASRVLVRRALQERDTLETARALARARVDYLSARADVVDAAAQLQTGSSAEGEQLSESIAAERARLELASEATADVEQRAAEATERARAERERATTEMEESIAEAWEALAPQLERIALERRLEEERAGSEALRAEELAAAQVDLGAQLAAIFESPRADREAHADVLFDELLAERSAARASRASASTEAGERRSIAASALASVGDARRARDLMADRELSSDLRARARELHAEQVRLAEEVHQLEELRLQTAEARVRHLEAEVYFTSRALDELIDALSPERRRALWRIERANIDEAATNLRERVRAFGLIWRGRIEQARNFRAEIGWAAMFEPGFEALVLLALYIGLRRSLPRWRDPLVARLLGLRELPGWRRRGRVIMKLSEVLYATLAQWLGLAFVAVVAIRTPIDVPEVALGVALASWLLGYRLLSRAARVVLIPRRDRPALTLSLAEGETQRLGIDLFAFTSRRAVLVLRTVRLCLLYVVSGRVGLAAVRALFGPGFVFHYASLLFQAVLVVVVYLLCWYWRRPIVELFCEAVGDEAARFKAWLREREGRPYIVLIVALLAVYLGVVWVTRTLTSWVAGRGPGQRVANFLFRRKLQRARHTTQAIALTPLALPVAYQRAFRPHPLTAEPYRLPRPQADTAFASALTSWRETRTRGTVAVVGDAGIGKTTFLRGLTPIFEGGPEPFTLVAPPSARLDEEGLLRWLASLLATEEAPAGPDAPTFDALVQAFSTSPPRAIAVDECERLFLRCVDGFRVVDRFLDLVTLTDHNVLWVLSFDRLAWLLLHRVRERRGYFLETIRLKPWTDAELRALVEARNEATGVHPVFDRLNTRGDEAYNYEVVRTSAGYYRLLAEIASGNPRVAQHLWLDSVARDTDGRVHVALFERPSDHVLKTLDDEQLFALTSLVQHNGLSTGEIATTINADPMACEVYVNHLHEVGILEPCASSDAPRRYRVSVSFYHATLARLRAVNLLHLR